VKSDSRGAVHFYVIDRAVGRSSLQLARGNLCVTDIPRAAKAKCHAQRTDGQFANAAIRKQEEAA